MDGRSVDAILKNADTAMYHAKALGRNNYQFFAEEMNRIANERLSLEGRLRQALARQELSLHYQPQMAADGSRVIGVEALLRWEAPNEGMIAPDRFIAIAEETGLIVPIGEWVLKEACRQLRTWLDAGAALRMAVNLSARQQQRRTADDRERGPRRVRHSARNCWNWKLPKARSWKNRKRRSRSCRR